MREWKELVREQLKMRGSTQSIEEDVIAEVAAHLEDAYDHERREGHQESDARKRALEQVQWHKLARRIRAAKREEGGMKDRKKTLWLPTFANLLLLTLGIQALLMLGIHPQIAVGQHVWFSFPIPWLLALTFCAAAGALLAKRGGASPGERMIAGLAPSLVWLGEFGVMAAAFGFYRQDFAPFPLKDSGLTAVWWVVLPVLALFAGTLPFLGEHQVGETQEMD